MTTPPTVSESRRTINDVEQDDKYLELLPYEHTWRVPLSALTWFQGNHNVAAPILEKRVATILEANPWLGGRIEKRKDKHVLVCQKTDPLVFSHASVSQSLSRDTPVDQLRKVVFPFLVRTNHGPKDPLWRVTVVPSSSETFGVIFSLSHAVADGHTFYFIHNMLFSNDSVVSMDAVRRMNFQQDAENMFGKEQLKFMLQPGVGVSMFKSYIRTKLPFFGPKMERQYLLIDSNKLKERKLAAATSGQVPYVSTNDYLTSWSFQATKCRFGSIVVDSRMVLPGYGNDLAGTYTCDIWYRPEDYSSAALIRKSLKGCKRAVTADNPLPSQIWEHWTATYARMTNLSMLAKKEMILEGCQEDFHIMIDPGIDLPACSSLCTVFRYGPGGKLCAGVIATAEIVRRLKEDPIVIGNL